MWLASESSLSTVVLSVKPVRIWTELLCSLAYVVSGDFFFLLLKCGFLISATSVTRQNHVSVLTTAAPLTDTTER